MQAPKRRRLLSEAERFEWQWDRLNWWRMFEQGFFHRRIRTAKDKVAEGTGSMVKGK